MIIFMLLNKWCTFIYSIAEYYDKSVERLILENGIDNLITCYWRNLSNFISRDRTYSGGWR